MCCHSLKNSISLNQYNWMRLWIRRCLDGYCYHTVPKHGMFWHLLRHFLQPFQFSQACLQCICWHATCSAITYTHSPLSANTWLSDTWFLLMETLDRTSPDDVLHICSSMAFTPTTLHSLSIHKSSSAASASINYWIFNDRNAAIPRCMATQSLLLSHGNHRLRPPMMIMWQTVKMFALTSSKTIIIA